MKAEVYIKFHSGEAEFDAVNGMEFLDFSMRHIYINDRSIQLSTIKEVHIKFLDSNSSQASDGAAVSTPT